MSTSDIWCDTEEEDEAVDTVVEDALCEPDPLVPECQMGETL